MYNVLETAYSAAFFKVFKTFDKHVIKQCQFYCGCLPLCYIIDKRRMLFLRNLQTVFNFCLFVLYETSVKTDFKKLINKHKLNNNSYVQFKNGMWKHFADSCLEAA